MRSWGFCVNTVLVQEILAWPQASSGCHFLALISHLTRQVNEPLSEPEVREAITWLSDRGLVYFDGNALRLSEPDRPELQLYPSLAQRFTAPRFLASLGVEPGTFVFQDTSASARRGRGPLTCPDFTLAAVKSDRFQRSVEVTTIEVKNRSGANLEAVYKVIAHGRISHFPFLACPRSKLEAAKIESIRKASEEQDIGLILFDIVLDGQRGLHTKNVRVEVRPKRRSPDMGELKKHLEALFTPDNCAQLEELAKGGYAREDH
jgi:hypothetical protein